MKTIHTLLLLLSGSLSLFAQQTGQVDYKTLGIRFTIPDGWVGQEGDGVFIMAHNDVPGLLILTTNTATSLEQIKQEARQGIQDENGTNLQISSDFETIAPNTLGAEFAGTAEWQPARAYVCGALNPHGQGVTILAMTLRDLYSDSHKAAALAVAKSLRFHEPETGPIIDQWKERISGTRLTYMESYSSMDYSNPSYTSGGGYSNKTVIDLCPQGYFNHSNSSSLHVDVGSTASGNSRSSGAGTWSVIVNIGGQAVLQLNFHEGEIYEYVLSMDGDKTLLNGTRYFRTWTGENAPYCP